LAADPPAVSSLARLVINGGSLKPARSDSSTKTAVQVADHLPSSAVQSPFDCAAIELLRMESNGRPFDAVIVESIDPLSRTTADATRVEREFEQLEVSLFAAASL